MAHVKRRSNCPISFALDIFGDRWTLLIIRDLMFKGKVHYGDFLRSEEGIATNILADRLQTLEHAGIVSKTRDLRKRTRFVYALTKKGLDLLPVLIEIVVWSAQYDPETEADRDFVARARRDREGLRKEVVSKLMP